jgi:N-acetylglucosamine-6-phosphate deacetylase
MIVLSGAGLVLPDRVVSNGTLEIDGDRIAAIRSGSPAFGAASHFALHGHYIVPGFIDVHVHGVAGMDTLGGAGSIDAIADALPQYGVTAFCPTTIACEPVALGHVLAQVSTARRAPARGRARVLPAHLESNFINAEYAGAQPVACLRSPRRPRVAEGANGFSADDILATIDRYSPDVGIITLAPELDGGLDLVARFSAGGRRVALGHSGASYEEGLAAIAAGARHATHLFNRMPPFNHRDPGLVGAILQSDEVAAEIICDGIHVHPAVVRTAVAAKHPSRIMAITDGTALSGLPPGASAALGAQRISSGDGAARLDDGTLAGSTLTMDGAFRALVTSIGVSLVDAATMCATTPARELGLVGHGVLAPDAIADLVVLDSAFQVVQTYIGGQLVYARSA